MKSCANQLFVLATLAFTSGGLHATPILCSPCTNIGTGQAPGTANTASDPFWTIYSAPSGNTSGPAVIIGSPVWTALTLPAGINWIATIPGAGSGGSTYAGGDYIYEFTFDAPAGGAALSGFEVAADNAVNVFLNASPATLAADGSSPCTVGAGGCLAAWGDFTNTNAAGWASFSPAISANIPAGLNTIYLEVENGSSSYTGVVAKGAISAAPEPATCAMLGAGLCLLGLLKRGRRRF